MELLNNYRGLSLIELIVTITILGILASGVIPLIKNSAVRTKEIELKRNLRIIRIAIDDYHKTYQKYVIPNMPPPSGTPYPVSLEDLTKVMSFGPTPDDYKFLRRPVYNPLCSQEDLNNGNNNCDKAKWGWEPLCMADNPGDNWCGNDVFDIYAPQAGTALDGSNYNEW